MRRLFELGTRCDSFGMSSTFDDSQSQLHRHKCRQHGDTKQVADPVLQAIQGAIIDICVSEPTTGAILGRLGLEPSVDIRTPLKLDRDLLLYSPERVKSLTTAELKKALANSVEK